MLTIFGSEISSVIGENKYKKRWESFLTVFKRVDNGKHYESAVERLKSMGHTIVDLEDKMHDIIHDTGIEAAAEQLLTTTVTNSDQLDQTICEFEFKLEQKEQELKEHKKQLKGNGNLISQSINIFMQLYNELILICWTR